MLRRSIAAVAASLVVLALPALGQEAPAEAELLRVASISAWTDRERPLRLTMQASNVGEVDLVDVSVRIDVYQRVLSRSQLRESLDIRPQGSPIGSARVDVGRVRPGEVKPVRFTRAMAAISPSITRTGVYPVVITLVHGGGEAPALRTAIPYIGSDPEERLNVAWVLPVTARTVMHPNGAFNEAQIETLGLPVLTQQLQAIAERRGIPVTLAFNPSFLAAARDLSDGYETPGGTLVGEDGAHARAAAAMLLQAGRAAAAVGELAGTTYAPVDLPTLAHRGTRGDLVRQLTSGRSEIEAHAGRAPTQGLLAAPGGRIDAAAADLLERAGTTVAILDEASVVPPSEPFEPRLFGPSRPVSLRTASATMTGLVTDTALRDRLDADDQGVLTAQALIAETASAWLELPLFAGDRVLTVRSTSMPSPPAISSALDGLRSAPWVRLVTASEAARELPPLGEPVAFSAQPTAVTENLVAARIARRSFRALEAIAEDLPPEMASLDRLILLAESAEWTAMPQRGSAYAVHVREQVARAFDNIRIARRSQVTLTSREGEIPITLVNDNAFPVRVRVRLSGTKVGFPEGDSRSRDLLASRPDTIDFAVEALATGSFPVHITIETPDGDRVIARSRFLLRSTAVSAVTLALVGGSALFLVVAWTRRAMREKKRARPAQS